MIIGKTKSNIGWEIENQYEILSQIIGYLAEHYQDEALDLEKEVDKIYNNFSDSDYETFSNEIQGLGEELDKRFAYSYEARKILFCAIFSYFESMLYGIIMYYKIPRGKANQPSQLIKKICEEYDRRSSYHLSISEDIKNTICNKYGLLRNYYMHGLLDRGMDRLIEYVQSEESINDGFEIKDNDYLRTALNTIKTFLESIEDAYAMKQRENRIKEQSCL